MRMMDKKDDNIHACLRLPTIKISVHLGHEAGERQQAQAISLDIRFKFSQLPMACHSDELSDTICYRQLAEDLQQYCQSQSFKLIEHLAWRLFSYLKAQFSGMEALSLTVKKTLPLANIQHSEFTLSDGES